MQKIDILTSVYYPKQLEEIDNSCGFRINKLTKAALIFIEIALTTAVIGLFTITLLNPATMPFTVLLATSIALAILLGNRILHCIHDKLPKSIQIVIDTIRGFVVDIFALIGCVSLWFFDMTKYDTKEINKSGDLSKDIPILLIHGYMHNSSAWWYHRYRLRQAGYKNIYSINLGFPTLKSVDDYAQKVNVKIQSIIQKHNEYTSNQIRLVGHSMGGLVAMNAMLKNTDANILNITTLGSPLQGTKLAYCTPGKCAKDMRYQQKFIQSFTQNVENTTFSTNLCHVGSEADLLIRPTSSATPSFKKDAKIIIFPNLGHITYLFNDSISDLIITNFK